MTTYYEGFLRRDIFYGRDDYVDLIIDIYEKDDNERHYINLVIEDYLRGGTCYEAHMRLMNNVVYKHLRQYECMGKYLDD